jgi:hypothetical protein
MKCLSLWQPWATLMAIGAKVNETRSWPTKYRGQVAIQAAKTWNNELHNLCLAEPFHAVLKRELGGLPSCIPRMSLPFGAIICIVNLDDCQQITRQNAPTGEELAFGDYTPGRFMFRTSGLIRLPKPIPYRGAQGLFDIPDDLAGLPQIAEATP